MANNSDRRIRMIKSAVTRKRTDRVKKPEREQMVRLRDTGRSLEDIAATLRRDARTVSKQLAIADKQRIQTQRRGDDSLNAIRLREHFDLLAEIARSFLDNDVGKVLNSAPAQGDTRPTYTIVSDVSGHSEIPQDELVNRIHNNIDRACEKYDATRVWDSLWPHLVAECPECDDYWSLLKTKPLEFVNLLRVVADRRTFKGICPVCKDLQ